jgi:predicted NAD-dependent protein-ADP-ribosyltransferase YbiA (DUF1768 family)
MVKSKINPTNIDYSEEKTVDDDDLYHASTRYNYTLHKMKIEIVLGKIRYTYSKYDVVFYPIYLVLGEEIDSKIGLFEIESNKAIEAVDEDGDIDLRKGNIIPFVSEAYLKKQLGDYEKEKEFQESQQPNNAETNEKEELGDVIEEVEEIDAGVKTQDDVLSLDIPENENRNKKADETLKDGIFTENKTIPLQPILPIETKQDSDKLKSEYTKSPSNVWMEDFAHNNNYKIIDNEGGGQCFFAVIRDAFKQIGKETEVENLRALLSKNASEDNYNHYRSLYLMFFDEIANIDKEISDIKKNSALLKKRITKAETTDIHKKLIDEAKTLLVRRDELLENKETASSNMEEFEYMKDIDSFEKFKDFIMTHNYWADDWAISTLERLLNIKMIILSEGDYQEGDKDSVIWSTSSSIMRCEVFNDEFIKKGEKFRPDYYIMTSYTGRHYKLITYKNKKIFKFQEVPYDVKVLVINKCMEKNSGIYYFIEDFCKMKTELGLPTDCGKPESDEDEYLNKDLYDKDVVFRFYSNANKQPQAGKGAGEKIPPSRLLEFSNLNNKKNKIMIDWRKKLDDSWPVTIHVDNHKWKTVKHYCLGSQFKRGFPDFYLEFSLDSNSKISQDLDLAIIAGSESGKLESKILRKPEIIVDSDYEIRKDSERKEALISKFSQNLDLKKMLLATKPARLDYFIRRNQSELDEVLMTVRKELS